MNPISQQSTLDSMNDAALLRLIADRQPEALGALYGRYASTLLALGKRILGSLSDAEEVLQEVFLHVWNNAARYDAGALVRLDLADPHHPQPGHRPPAHPQGGGAHARNGNSRESGRACIP